MRTAEPARQTNAWPRAALLLLAATTLAACQASPPEVTDPVAALQTPGEPPHVYRAAIAGIDAAPADDESLRVLRGVVWRPGFSVDVREQAVDVLAERDLAGLQRTIRQKLPLVADLRWRARLCEIVAERGWRELAPALVSAWARPLEVAWDDDERPERAALARLYGEDRVVDVVFEMFVESSSVAEQGLRTRCWELLHRLGARDRLVALLAETSPAADDAMLVDLAAGARDLGIVPRNREEILRLRELRRPENEAFWRQATVAVRGLDARRRAELELRDLPIVVSASLHDAAVLDASDARLYAQLEAYLDGRRRYGRTGAYGGPGRSGSQRLRDHRDELTWGDLAAMTMAVRALEVPQVVAHLFDYAERDRADRSTEYGGVIRLDGKDRFEVLEFPPRIRQHDERFNASQEMIDAAVTALFHFHYHVQRFRNADFAGPGFGDLRYADNLRANCLVLTYVDEGRLNVDYYRHGSVVVDLGVIDR